MATYKYRNTCQTHFCKGLREKKRLLRNVVPFVMLYKVVLTFETVDETLVCVHSNESY